jgi:mono/diheme cytochrome c family protein
VRPGHFSEAEYYASPVDNYRTYPVYAAGREPAGYWERLQKAKPEPLIDTAQLKTKADWIAAGKRVFEEADIGSFRQYAPEIIEEYHKATSKRVASFRPAPDGTIPGARWVVTNRGLALTSVNCTGCHQRTRPDGSTFNGPGLTDITAFTVIGNIAHVPGMSTIPLPGDSEAMGLWRSFATPWIPGDLHESLKTMDGPAIGRLFASAAGPNITPRWNGSLFYPTKVPDLTVLKGQKYIDHTGTHKLRGLGDIMRYAALVTYADATDYGPHHLLTDEQRKIPYHLPDEALYAMALYIDSLEPPANPNRMDDRAAAGKKIFDREGCSGCHTPPYYTSGKLTLADGFTPSKELLREYDVLPVSVKTDPSLAMKTRKGTGFYKIPSLRGVWYRGRYLHDGAVTTLEEMFNPDRLKSDFVPSGFKGLDKTRAVRGHEFGLRISAPDRESLIAFLKTL